MTEAKNVVQALHICNKPTPQPLATNTGQADAGQLKGRVGHVNFAKWTPYLLPLTALCAPFLPRTMPHAQRHSGRQRHRQAQHSQMLKSAKPPR